MGMRRAVRCAGLAAAGLVGVWLSLAWAEEAAPPPAATARFSFVATLEGHAYPVLGVACSRDGLAIASGGEDGVLKLWDGRAGRCLRTVQAHPGSRILAVALSPDGTRVATASSDCTLKVWDWATGAFLRRLGVSYQERQAGRARAPGHRHGVKCCAFSPDGARLVSGDLGGILLVWDPAEGSQLRVLGSHEGRAECVAFSADGLRIASGGEDGLIKVWDATTGRCAQTLKGHKGWVESVAFSPDGKETASGSRDQAIKVWDLAAGQCRMTLQGHAGWVVAVAFAPDGKRVASGGGDATLKVWDAAMGNCLQTLEGHTRQVSAIALAADGARLVSASEDRTLRLWAPEAAGAVAALPKAERPAVASPIPKGTPGIPPNPLDRPPEPTPRPLPAVKQEPPTPLPQVAAGGDVPQTEQAAKLARELVDKLNATYYSLRALKAPAFDATFAVTVDGKPVGTYAPSWDGVGASVSAKLDVGTYQNLIAVVTAPIPVALIQRLEPAPSRHATVTADGPVMDDFAPPPPLGVKKVRFTLSADLRRVQERGVREDGEEVLIETVAEPAEGKLFVRTARAQNGRLWRCECTLTYTHRDSFVFLRRLEAKLTSATRAGGDATVPILLELQNVTFRTGGPAPKGPPPATVAPGPTPTPRPEPVAPPGGIDPRQTSDDPTYGTTKENPVKVGAPEAANNPATVALAGPLAERAYLSHLRDAQSRPFRVERRGSVGPGPDGHLLDVYDLSGEDGSRHTLYLDMYHPEAGVLQVKAPKGMYFAK